MEAAPTQVACLHCREKHLKCDGNASGCARCISLNLYCQFVASRRGRKTRPGPYHIPQTPGLENYSTPAVITTPLFPLDNILEESGTVTVPQSVGQQGLNIHLISSYYSNFHTAHPFLPPFQQFLQSNPPKYIIEVIEFVSSQYLPAHYTVNTTDLLISSVDKAGLSVEKVQSFLLLSIVSHGRQNPEKARTCLSCAIKQSLDLGMHQRQFSDNTAMQDPIRAESIRRTWWEIFVVDTLLAALQIEGSLQVDIEEYPDVPLPLEKNDYSDSCIGSPLICLRDLERQLLPHEEGDFSSLAYRVEAAITLRKCLLVTETQISQQAGDIPDASVASWFHRIPKSKRATMDNTGEIDHPIFQAIMIMHCASIYLHYPRSYLPSFLPSTNQVICYQPPGPSVSANPLIHTAKVVSSAVSVSKLASLSTLTTSHTPFFACAMVLSSVIQLAVLSADWLPSFGANSQYVGLNIGVLNSMGDTWEIARVSMRRIREMTSGVLDTQTGDSRVLLNVLDLQP
ncbi:hypothetical protein ASPVEDRAFT_25516 [Aspergillus versicolor CBS 583.65]|uniref:Zn(2)-C6 fungal-type domain-containing protein n=1 Tax=Aspergillus versicolor CBS 583.65 TaxID=1036611 RepID=A0A1L9PAU3_ASPVE|nr:uncharacterized protein ASPVEDRAFT_25516 [Aspergillus versicolor CBS 583.65]OJI98657.1 hypothetical protein ASPVEDRAFT_25516 [Aspergillus versicolor CBS 583.65]